MVARPRTRSTASSCVGGVRAARPGRRASAPRRTSSTRPTSGPGPVPSARPSPATTSSTPARRSSAPTVARWVAEEGLCLDVCSGGELAVALRAGFDPARIGFHGNNKTEAELAPAPSTDGVGRIIVDSFDEIERLAEVAARARPDPAGDGAGDRRRRGAHPRVHRHRPRGPEVRLLDRRRRRPRGRTPGARRPGPRAARPALPHRQPDLRHLRLRGGRPAGARAARPGRRASSASTLPELDLGGGFGIAYTTQDDPSEPDAAGHRDEQDRRARVPRARRRPSRGSRSSRAGRSSARPCARVYEVGTVKQVELDGGAARTYVCVDGGMSDNIRTALYDADYSCTLASARLRRAAGPGPGRRQALRGRRHRGQGRVPARRRPPRRPGRGPRHRRLLPVDGLQLQPRAAAAGGRGAGRCRARPSSAARLWTTCWPPTWERRRERQTAEGRRAGLRLGRLAGGAAAARAGRRPGGPGRCARSSWSASPYAGSTRRARSRCPRGCSPPTPRAWSPATTSTWWSR